MTMEPTLDAYAAAFRRALEGWEDLVAALTAEAFNRRPPDGGWSVAQCMDHVAGTSARYLPGLEDVVARGGPAGAPPFRYDRRGRMFIDETSETVRRRRKTLRAMEPSQEPIDPAAALEAYRGHTARFLELLAKAEGIDLARIRMGSPYLPRIPFLTFPVGALIEVCAGHELRHLAQARRVGSSS